MRVLAEFTFIFVHTDQQVTQLHQEGRVTLSQSGDSSVTVVGSQQLIQHQQLLQLLETRQAFYKTGPL